MSTWSLNCMYVCDWIKFWDISPVVCHGHVSWHVDIRWISSVLDTRVYWTSVFELCQLEFWQILTKLTEITLLCFRGLCRLNVDNISLLLMDWAIYDYVDLHFVWHTLFGFLDKVSDKRGMVYLFFLLIPCCSLRVPKEMLLLVPWVAEGVEELLSVGVDVEWEGDELSCCCPEPWKQFCSGLVLFIIVPVFIAESFSGSWFATSASLLESYRVRWL